ncbi:aryl-alcohol dehydrogenase-like predicted oxidoreductase [Kribbella orskensis]|uniref:Aryl-alcohol dehydrogenase-like predicted oxidoreductase n=1 Tax=Kribbella orskensis TaxID=2512216 RepID=A0ABY2BG24_9ACTN|nr:MULTISPECIES: aldo/keto reductase [Kribbella]TCN37539.1 aryl-alcohol dehydrogenase-like predicted oxidoreductase [Kribbella sp. VKM Ac-2500]TCO18959.1 aryl-alcohol dehydrogenase-like predicted oxidoreductase [Kribbella orskensis]
MPDTKLRWGILGTGNIASRFASQLPSSTTGELAAVGSRSTDSANEFGGRYAIPNRHGSYQELLDDPTVDAVYIATPHPLHVEWAIKTAEAGKHVLCEKPLAINRSLAAAMIEAAVRNDVFLMEAYMYRCLPQTKLIAQLVRDGAIGTVHQIQASFAFQSSFRPESRIFADELAGGGILDVGGYPVSMARLIAGAAVGAPYADPAAVTAVGQVGETGVDEWSVATLFFDSGLTAQVSTGVRLGDENRVRVLGSEGYLVIEDPWFGGDGKPTHVTVHKVGEQSRDISAEPAYIYAAEADAVAAAIEQRQAPEMSWADTLGNLAVQDEWRKLIGQQYASERDDAIVPTLTGRPLTRRADAPMKYGQVAGLDKQVSRLVMGVDNQETLTHAATMFDDFVERGGTTFDTAYIYGRGRGEKLLGQWIRSRGNRDEVVVIGKGAHTPHCDPESITRQLGESLERLQTDHVDLYLMHRDNEEVPVGEFVDVMDEHFRAGRIKAYGGSNWSTARFDEANAYAAANGKQPLTLLSNHLSLALAYDVPWAGCRHVSDDQSQAWLRERQVALFPWSSQARGFFTGRAKPEDRSDEELVRCFYSDENFERLRRARVLAEARGVEPTAIALAWLLHQPYPVFPLIGPRQISETRTSLPGLSVELTDEDVAWLTALD